MPNDTLPMLPASSSSTTSSTGIAINFEKLAGISNYGNWKFLMYLVNEDLWDCIEESAQGHPKVSDDRKQLRALKKPYLTNVLLANGS